MASSPSKAEGWDQLTKHVKIPDTLYKAVRDNTPNILDTEDALLQSLEGNHTGKVTASVDSFVAQCSSAYQSATDGLADTIKALLQYGYGFNTEGVSDKQLVQELAREMKAASETVKSRDITRGSVSASGVSGSDGTVLRNTIDKHGHNIESGMMGTIVAEVMNDKNSGGIPGRERIDYYMSGQPERAANSLDFGVAIKDRVTDSLRVAGAENILRDGSFDSILLNNNQVGKFGWHFSDAANFTAETETIYRFKHNTNRQVTPSGRAIKFNGTADDTLVQYIAQGQNQAFSSDVPYLLVVHWNRVSTATGTLNLRLGSKTASATIGSATAGVWNRTVIGLSSGDCWYDNFKEDWTNPFTGLSIPDRGEGVRVSVGVDTLSGAVIVDEILLIPMTEFNGCWYAAVAGTSDGDALKGDKWTFTDSANETGRTQLTIAKKFSVSLPSTTGTPTYADA